MHTHSKTLTATHRKFCGTCTLSKPTATCAASALLRCPLFAASPARRLCSAETPTTATTPATIAAMLLAPSGVTGALAPTPADSFMSFLTMRLTPASRQAGRPHDVCVSSAISLRILKSRYMRESAHGSDFHTQADTHVTTSSIIMTTIELGPRWTMLELHSVFTLVRHIANAPNSSVDITWTDLAVEIPTRTPAMLRALFELHHTHLTQPSATLRDFVAAVANYYDSLDASASAARGAVTAASAEQDVIMEDAETAAVRATAVRNNSADTTRVASSLATHAARRNNTSSSPQRAPQQRVVSRASPATSTVAPAASARTAQTPEKRRRVANGRARSATGDAYQLDRRTQLQLQIQSVGNNHAGNANAVAASDRTRSSRKVRAITARAVDTCACVSVYRLIIMTSLLWFSRQRPDARVRSQQICRRSVASPRAHRSSRCRGRTGSVRASTVRTTARTSSSTVSSAWASQMCVSAPVRRTERATDRSCADGCHGEQITRAARPVWSSVRASMGRPRRLSQRFFAHEKSKLARVRAAAARTSLLAPGSTVLGTTLSRLVLRRLF